MGRHHQGSGSSVDQRAVRTQRLRFWPSQRADSGGQGADTAVSLEPGHRQGLAERRNREPGLYQASLPEFRPGRHHTGKNGALPEADGCPATVAVVPQAARAEAKTIEQQRTFVALLALSPAARQAEASPAL